MVFFNYATMQMAAKIVYYGPGLCGKTTNLHHIYTKTSPQSRGEMVSLETETDRTLFFDLLPIDVGVIGGFKTRLQLYTVPGQVFYNTTRKLVLKGVDGIVFVADSQQAILDANVESLKNLRENLAEIGLTLDEIPTVIQLNKRDLPNIASPETIMTALDPERKLDYVEAVAARGDGVFETLKLISKLTLRTLRRRMTGEEPIRPAPAARIAQFRVQSNDAPPSPVRTLAQSTPTPTVTAPVPAVAATALAESQPVYAPPQVQAFDPDATVAAASLDRNILAHAPVAEPEPEPIVPAVVKEQGEERTAELEDEAPLGAADSLQADTAPGLEIEEEPQLVDEVPELEIELPPPAVETPIAAAPVPAATPSEPEIDFNQTDRPQKVEEVKTVKVRSSVDVMAELEALRKRATNTSPKAAKRDPLADLSALRPRRDLHRTANLSLPADVLPKAKTVRVTLSFEDGESGTVETREHVVELGDTTDAQSLSVNLKIDLA
jgi:signal recognition particle receptor subunit beta